MKKDIMYFSGILILTLFSYAAEAKTNSESDSTFPGIININSYQGYSSSGWLLSDQQNEKSRHELTKFFFSIAVTPHFKPTVPPINVNFEHGIAGLASLGISFGATYDSEPEIEYHSATISIGTRGCAYALPIISKISGDEIKNFGFQPYLGLVYDYFITAVSIEDNDIDPVNYSRFGICAGTRWYPGKGKFGLLGEFNSNGIGSKIRFGISLGR